ncbi:MAG: response regulator transcription factor [Clostridia bacterium]|nr:response regulator transcription factor [Clostridia bacterium]
MYKILIVEDEANIAKMIEATLSIVGYGCDICDDGMQACELIVNRSYDLVLLDVMLPGIDGFEVMERIADRGTPVIFLTAMQNVADKVRGLKLGAEDYIVKPFEAVELLARIEDVLRRAGKSHKRFDYDEITVDIDKHIALKNGAEVVLTPKEFEVLVFFMQNQDIAINRERLLSAVWGYEFAGESRTVDIHVQQLRKKMGLQGRLVTIPKLGYRLEKR